MTQNNPTDISTLRENYAKAALDLATLKPSPFVQFSNWMEEAISGKLPEPNAMTLATADAQGRPSARIVLLKGLGENGFTFYTNYSSRKGQELTVNPNAALVFLWKELERQVRIEGIVSKISAEESDAYFNARPLGSRLGAIASPQSAVIEDRAILADKLAALEGLDESEVKRPANWGGYRLLPRRIEFWQGRPNRLHDRFCYKAVETSGQTGTAGAQKWKIERLAP